MAVVESKHSGSRRMHNLLDRLRQHRPSASCLPFRGCGREHLYGLSEDDAVVEDRSSRRHSWRAPDANGVPHGFLAIYVGKEHKRFVVPAMYLNRPGFRLLLDKAKEEYGFSQKGGLTVPCEVTPFERFLSLLNTRHDDDMLEMMDASNLEKYYLDKYHLAFQKVSMEDDGAAAADDDD